MSSLVHKLLPKSWLKKKPIHTDNKPHDNTPCLEQKQSTLSYQNCIESPGSTTSIPEDEIKQVFDHLDENGDGAISPDELRRLSRRVGGSDTELSVEEAEIAVRSSDVDGDGVLGLEDFTKLLEGGGGEAELRGVFEMYAAEETGCITPKSLKKMLGRLSAKTTVEKCEGMIGKFDLDGDGVISFDEFRVMMTRANG